MHHSNYVRWFEETRVDYLEKIGFPYETVMERGVHIIITGFSCECKGMIKFGDEVTILASVKSFGHASMTIGYEIIKDGALCVSGETSHCGYSQSRGKIVSLRKELPEMYGLLAGK